ncbi:hypothetical protein [Priestia megaterium]|uniref:hypothetical protein n=1 Tax=Priestia megaterium TaxID=1404 RepID=UPI003CC58291
MGLVADVFEMLVIDKKTSKVYSKSTLQESGIQFEQEANDVTGGPGNDLIAILHGRKDITITGNDPIWDMELLALRMGSDIVTGTNVAYAIPQDYFEAVTGADPDTTEITLPHAAIAGTVKIKKEDGTDVEGFTLDGMDVTFPEATVAEGEKVQVVTYQYNTPAGTKTTTIDSTKFPKDVMIVLRTLEISEDEQPLNWIQFEFDRVKPSPSFNINTSSAREASVDENSFRVMKPKYSKTLGRKMIIPYDEVTP